MPYYPKLSFFSFKFSSPPKLTIESGGCTNFNVQKTLCSHGSSTNSVIINEIIKLQSS